MSDIKEVDLTFTIKPSGNCPVQAEGFIDGKDFYFRARGEHLHFYVGWLNDVKFCHEEEYKGSVYQYFVNGGENNPRMCAGWATEEECYEFINRAVKSYMQNSKGI